MMASEDGLQRAGSVTRVFSVPDTTAMEEQEAGIHSAAKRLLFVSVPMHGHLNPLLQPAKLLMSKGHAVLFAVHEQLVPVVEAAGLPCTSLGQDTVEYSKQQHVFVDPLVTKKERMLASAAMYTGWEEEMFRPLRRACQAFRPDVLVADMTTLAAHDVAEALKVPLALLGSMPLTLALDMCGYGLYNRDAAVPFEAPGVLVLPEQMSLLERVVLNPLAKKVFGDSSILYMPMLRARDRLRERFGLPDLPLCAGPLQPSRRIPRTITILATSWLMETKRELPRNFHLVGAMGCDFTRNFPPPLEQGATKAFLDRALAAGRRTVLVATGTSVMLQPPLVAEMAAAFEALPDVSFVWALKQASQAHLPRRPHPPPNVLITPWVPQTAVLGHPAVKALLCHGGHTTTNEALAVGRPLLVMPFGGDQPVVAQHVKNHGYGLTVSPVGLKAEALAGSITALLSDPRFAEVAAEAGHKTRRCCGPALTAWLLADFARDPPPSDSSDEEGSDDNGEGKHGPAGRRHV